MEFDAFFDQRLVASKSDGNFCVFADLERHRNNYLNATLRKDG